MLKSVDSWTTIWLILSTNTLYWAERSPRVDVTTRRSLWINFCMSSSLSIWVFDFLISRFWARFCFEKQEKNMERQFFLLIYYNLLKSSSIFCKIPLPFGSSVLLVLNYLRNCERFISFSPLSVSFLFFDFFETFFFYYYWLEEG